MNIWVPFKQCNSFHSLSVLSVHVCLLFSPVQTLFDSAKNKTKSVSPYLAPYEHGAEHDLQPVKEVVADEDHRGSAGGPAFTGANGLYARGSCLWQDRKHSAQDRALSHTSIRTLTHTLTIIQKSTHWLPQWGAIKLKSRQSMNDLGHEATKGHGHTSDCSRFLKQLLGGMHGEREERVWLLIMIKSSLHVVQCIIHPDLTKGQ